jgi:hypothetical protein
VIRRLTEDDRAETMRLLEREVQINLFIVGDVENYGFDAPFQRLWGNFDAAGRLRSILHQYYDALILYTADDPERLALADTIRALDFRMLSGGAISVEPIAAAMSFSKTKRTILCRLSRNNLTAPESPKSPFRPLTLADVDALIALYSRIEEFSETPRRMLEHELSAGHGRGCWIEHDGAMVSIARSAAESTRAAMIIGVATLPEYRNRGYATAAMTDLCRRLCESGRTPCLFYDNPHAGRIYRRMGFEEIGNYVILER